MYSRKEEDVLDTFILPDGLAICAVEALPVELTCQSANICPIMIYAHQLTEAVPMIISRQKTRVKNPAQNAMSMMIVIQS